MYGNDSTRYYGAIKVLVGLWYVAVENPRDSITSAITEATMFATTHQVIDNVLQRCATTLPLPLLYTLADTGAV